MTEWEGLIRLSLAAVLGGVIGIERETLAKAAGLRTHMLVALGAAVFMVGSVLLVEGFGEGDNLVRVDPTRIASTIVTGVGFLGAGIIFKDRHEIRGLTTAAGLWVAAAIGFSSGAGFYIIAIGGTLLAVLILGFMRRVEAMLARRDSEPPRTRDRTDG